MSEEYSDFSVVRREGNRSEVLSDHVARECPLEITVNGELLAKLMRTPGDDLNLVAGFLYSSGIIEGADDIETVRVLPGDFSLEAYQCEDENSISSWFQDVTRIEVSLRRVAGEPLLKKTGFAWDVEFVSRVKRLVHLRRKAEAGKPPPIFASSVIFELAEALTQRQPVFGLTGGTHAAGIFDTGGRIIIVCEDVGRHNALDKAVGSCLRSSIDFADKGLILSGRASFEMVFKAAVSGLPLLCSVSAPTSLGIYLARELGLAVVGFLREGRFNIYSHEWRIS